MTRRGLPSADPARYIAAMSHALTKVSQLIDAGLAQAPDGPRLEDVARDFRIRITPEMQQNSPGIARQFVPDPAELITRPEELSDPIGDSAHQAAPGLTHRYPDRAILHVTRSCDVYCRFCFRREIVGQTGPLPGPDLDAALSYLARTPEIREVILTGGDPMTLSPRRLGAVLDRLQAIAHVKILRLHSRVPVVAPDRVAGLLAVLRRVVPVYVVIHSNHADELTESARAAIRTLRENGNPLLSQTVLLRGINDDADTLAHLLRELTELGVVPYYLHHCDLARGTSHFRTTIDAGLALIASLRGRLSGMAVPRYVLDLPGGFGKVPLDSAAVQRAGPGRWRITDWQGRVHDYADP